MNWDEYEDYPTPDKWGPFGEGEYSSPEWYHLPTIGDKIRTEPYGLKPRVWIRHKKSDIGKVGIVIEINKPFELVNLQTEDGSIITWATPHIKIINN